MIFMTMLILVTTNPNTSHSVLWWDMSIIENHSSMASQAKKKKFNPVVQIERERERDTTGIRCSNGKVKVYRFGIPPRNKVRDFTR